MKWVALSAIALSAFLSGSALAADVPVYKARPLPPPPVYTWTGCYLGAGGGYGMWNQDRFLSNPEDPSEFTPTETGGGRGWFGTVQVGCDYQFSGDWVIGAFGDYDFGNIHGKIAFFDAFSGEEKESSAGSVGVRLGYVVMPNLLAFVGGGWREAHFNSINAPFALSGNCVRGNGPCTENVGSHTYSGWFLSTGYEYGLKWFPGLFWKTEYRFAEFRGANLPVFLFHGVTDLDAILHSKKWEQTLRSELVWRFNWFGKGVPY